MSNLSSPKAHNAVHPEPIKIILKSQDSKYCCQQDGGLIKPDRNESGTHVPASCKTCVSDILLLKHP